MGKKVVKSKFLKHHKGPIPYKLKPEIQMWEYCEEWDKLKIVISVQSKNPSEHRTLLGSGGNKIKIVSSEVEEALSDFFCQDIKLNITVKPLFTQKPKPVPQTQTVELFL